MPPPCERFASAQVGPLIGQIDPAALQRHMEALAAVGSRDPRHPGHEKAIEYIRSELQKLSVGISEHRTVYQGIPLTNVIVDIGSRPTRPTPTPGRGDPPPIPRNPDAILISAHYDSIANRTSGWRAAVDPAPGADDNATGTAALLEFARILSLDKSCLEKDIVLAFFDGEELFFKGSAAYLQSLPQPYPFAYTINIDMVGFNPIADRLDLIWYGPQSDDLRDRVKALNDRYAIGVQLVEVFANNGNTYILDSAPFGLAGIPSVTLAERYGPADATYPGNSFFHTVTDTPDKVTNKSLWLKAAKLTLAVAVDLAKTE